MGWGQLLLLKSQRSLQKRRGNICQSHKRRYYQNYCNYLEKQMHSFFRTTETKSVEFNVNKRHQAQGGKTQVPSTRAGSSRATDIKERRSGAAGRCFIHILAEESAGLGKAKGESGNVRKAIQDTREHTVPLYFKSTVRPCCVQFCSLQFKDTVGERKGKSETQMRDVSRNDANVTIVTYHEIRSAEMS